MPKSDASTTILLANSIPVVRRVMFWYATLVKLRNPQ
jgi:hypothetical protein